MRIGKVVSLAAGLALIVAFFGLERTAPVRANFTLTGTVDCGRSSGAACSLGDTIVIVSMDSGAPTKYTINISWLKDLPALDQDDYISIDIEKLPNGVLQALNLTDISGQSGTSNPGVRAVKSTTTTTTDDEASFGECLGDLVSTTAVITTTSASTITVVRTFTDITATTETNTTTTSTSFTTTVVIASRLPCGEQTVTTTETTSTDP